MFGRRGLFGKQPPKSSETKHAAPQGPERVFDKGLWDGARGDFLRQAGLFPDDPINRPALQGDVSALLAHDATALTQALRALNDASPHPIGAFHLLREDLWRGRFGGFLLQRLDLSPHRPWNVIFLPLDSAGEAAMGLPMGSYDNGDIEVVEMVIEMIAELYVDQHSPEADATAMMCDVAADKFPILFPPEILEFSPAVNTARRRVRAFAFLHAATERLDKDVILKSQLTFLMQPEQQLLA